MDCLQEIFHYNLAILWWWTFLKGPSWPLNTVEVHIWNNTYIKCNHDGKSSVSAFWIICSMASLFITTNNWESIVHTYKEINRRQMTPFIRLVLNSALSPSIGKLDKLERIQSTETKVIKAIKLSTYETELNELTHGVRMTAIGKLEQPRRSMERIFQEKEGLSVRSV